jgi:hypothetical protein
MANAKNKKRNLRSGARGVNTISISEPDNFSEMSLPPSTDTSAPSVPSAPLISVNPTSQPFMIPYDPSMANYSTFLAQISPLTQEQQGEYDFSNFFADFELKAKCFFLEEKYMQTALLLKLPREISQDINSNYPELSTYHQIKTKIL